MFFLRVKLRPLRGERTGDLAFVAPLPNRFFR